MAQTNDAQGSKLEDMATNREQFQKLCALGIEEELKASLSADVKKELLESLSSIQLENIDVDTNHGGRASSVMYFQPFPPIEGEMKQVLSWGWSEMSPGEAPWVYPEHKAGWFMGPWDESATLEDDETEIDRFGGSAWRCIEYVLSPRFEKKNCSTIEENSLTFAASRDRCCVRDTTGLVLPSGHVFCNPTAYTHSSEYFSDFAFFPKDEKKPHLACIISDTFISPDMILRSEVHGAVALIMHQLAIKRFSDHRVKPVSSCWTRVSRTLSSSSSRTDDP